MKNLELTQEERARITDSKHKIQSANSTLAHVDPQKIPALDEIQDCLESADETLRDVLGGRTERPESGRKKS